MSVSASLVYTIFKLKHKLNEAESEADHKKLLKRGEIHTPEPKIIRTRYTDNANGRIFYINEGSTAGYTVFYLHGGAYEHDFSPFQWRFIKQLVEKTDATVIAPAYRLVPFSTWKEAFDLVIPVYDEYTKAHPDRKIIIMGDSSGGGLALAVSEQMKIDGIKVPDELVLMSPWVDAVMDNPDIKNYESEDPWLSVPWLNVCARSWAGDLDTSDYRISPIKGDLEGIHHITVFSGTKDILYPDLMKFYEIIKDDDTNEMIIGNDMMHVYPLLPISEAKPACERIFEIVKR